MTRSWNCTGCTNKCLMVVEANEVREYCRVIYDQPKNKGIKWEGETLVCLDYTNDPKAYDKQVRVWTKNLYKRKGEEPIIFQAKTTEEEE